eukprot:COSAG01_NODE_10506_length_2149_cov_5.011707_2_plen_178_part_00
MCETRLSAQAIWRAHGHPTYPLPAHDLDRSVRKVSATVAALSMGLPIKHRGRHITCSCLQQHDSLLSVQQLIPRFTQALEGARSVRGTILVRVAASGKFAPLARDCGVVHLPRRPIQSVELGPGQAQYRDRVASLRRQDLPQLLRRRRHFRSPQEQPTRSPHRFHAASLPARRRQSV